MALLTIVPRNTAVTATAATATAAAAAAAAAAAVESIRMSDMVWMHEEVRVAVGVCRVLQPVVACSIVSHKWSFHPSCVLPKVQQTYEA